MREILPDFDAPKYVEAFKKLHAAYELETDDKKKKKQPTLKAVLEGTQIYQDKHYTRVEGQLRNSYFADYILS